MLPSVGGVQLSADAGLGLGFDLSGSGVGSWPRRSQDESGTLQITNDVTEPLRYSIAVLRLAVGKSLSG